VLGKELILLLHECDQVNIQLASDLHLEFLQQRWPGERLITPQPGADVLVLAGDVASGMQACHLFADWPAPVIYVAGNHEFYGHPIDPMYDKLREAAAKSRGRFHFLENDSLVIHGVRMLGATLWTDYRLGSNRTQSQLMAYCGTRLNDHFQIRKGRHAFTPSDALARHKIARAWLETELAKPFDGKTVVVSHHAPHPLSVHSRYIGDQLNAAFVSDLSDLMPGVDLWLHGHVHNSFEYQVGECRVVANPAGQVRNRGSAAYPWDFLFENEAFNPNLLLEV
jgi:predicted phosphodiesterase